MSRPTDFTIPLLIIASAVLGAVAIVMMPALFEEFNVKQLVVVVVLLASTIAFGITAKLSRRKGTN